MSSQWRMMKNVKCLKNESTRLTRCSEKTLSYHGNKWIAQLKKTFYTCSTESLFLRYKKISKKAVKIGGFLQCSVHIFLGHDGYFLKIDLRVFWNYIMKNFQVKFSQCSSIIFSKKFSFENSWWLLDLCLTDSKILYFLHVLESILKFIIKLHALQCWFIRGSEKQPRRGRIILNFTNGQTFSFLMTTKCYWS